MRLLISSILILFLNILALIKFGTFGLIVSALLCIVALSNPENSGGSSNG